MKLGRAVRFNEDAHLEMSSSYSRSGQGSKIPRKCCLIADSKESSKKFLVILTHRCLKVVVTLMVILPSPGLEAQLMEFSLFWTLYWNQCRLKIKHQIQAKGHQGHQGQKAMDNCSSWGSFGGIQYEWVARLTDKLFSWPRVSGRGQVLQRYI